MKKIPLNHGAIANVDDEDYLVCNKYHYFLQAKGYAVRWIGKNARPQQAYLHQDIMGISPEGMVIDHINQNRLDNRKCNLRFVTRAQNRVNSRKQDMASIQDIVEHITINDMATGVPLSVWRVS